MHETLHRGKEKFICFYQKTGFDTDLILPCINTNVFLVVKILCLSIKLIYFFIYSKIDDIHLKCHINDRLVYKHIQKGVYNG